MNNPSDESASSSAPMASAKADLRQLNVNTKATVEELQDFLRQLKGRSPQEMLGVVAASQLFRAIVLSTILVAAGVMVFTVVPFFMNGGKPTATAETPAPAPATPGPAPAPESAPAPTPGEGTAPEADPISKLGVGEEKKAPPNVNPLEGKKDDFLKGLD